MDVYVLHALYQQFGINLGTQRGYTPTWAWRRISVLGGPVHGVGVEIEVPILLFRIKETDLRRDQGIWNNCGFLVHRKLQTVKKQWFRSFVPKPGPGTHLNGPDIESCL